MNEKEHQTNRIPSVNVAIIGSAEVGFPALIKSEGLSDAIGAVSVAAMLSAHDNSPLVLESKRLDVFLDNFTHEQDILEGIPSELLPGKKYALKGTDDSTSISSRMIRRPSRIKQV